MRKTLIITLLIIVVSLTLIPLSFAQTAPPIIPAGTEGELVIPHSAPGSDEGQYFGFTFLPSITQSIIGLAGGMAFLFIIIGGIQILTAYGNDEKITNAKKTIQYAIVGLLIALLSYAIVSIIGGLNIGQNPNQTQTAEEGFGDEGLTEEELAEKQETQKEIEEKVESGDLAPGSEDLTKEEMEELLD